MLKDGTTTKSGVGTVFERTFSMLPDLSEYKGVAGYTKNGACGTKTKPSSPPLLRV